MRILVTGATGYIGGRLVPHLLDAGHEVRCMARDPSKLSGDPWRDRVGVVAGDILDVDSLKEALTGCDAAYYLVHSMAGGSDFVERDRQGAANFRDAADATGLRRIVYLGGLGDDTDDLSHHLDSRHEVGRILRSGTTPVTELRAAVIIGSGSVSFEMLRYLTEVLPVMITPRWVRTRCQPTAIRDVLAYLTSAIEDTAAASSIYEIGGPDVLTYEDMMRVYAEVAGLRRRLIIPVPVLSPKLSSHWIGLVTPLPTDVAKPLVDSLKHEVVVTRNDIQAVHPIDRTHYRDAVEGALAHQRGRQVPTRWSDSGGGPAAPAPNDPSWAGGTVFEDRREVPTPASPADLFWAISRVGGDVGYYTARWAWRLRGTLDTLVGGVGLRRGRRHPEELQIGESLDFWRVADLVPGRRLQLFAEMKLPGEAWLEWEAVPDGSGSRLVQTAYFAPRGLWGRLYWAAVFPFHAAIFGRMARKMATAAEHRPA